MAKLVHINPDRGAVYVDVGGSGRIGKNVTIGNNVTIGEGVEIGNGVTLDYGVTIGNNAEIGNGVTIGANARIGVGVVIRRLAKIGQRVRIGDEVLIGECVSIGRNIQLGYNVAVREGRVDEIICAGRDHRGYEFLAAYDNVKQSWRILAGCRDFNFGTARRHWANNPEALHKLDYLEAEIDRLDG